MAVFAAFCPGWPWADFALTEIIEYVRVSVQIVFEEIGAPATVNLCYPQQ